MAQISDELAKSLVALFGPRVQVEGAKAAEVALRALLEAERHRRGEPDASGAFHALALTQGSLLRYEYDLSTHGHHAGWTVGAVVVDIKALILVNQEHGFAAGDELVSAVAGTLIDTYPSAKVVRIHSDAFAVLLAPSSELGVTDAHEAKTRAALAAGVPQRLVAASHPRLTPEYSIALLELTVARPSHWQVLGPIVWAECERAYAMARAGQASGVQQRHLDLNGAVPMTHGAR